MKKLLLEFRDFAFSGNLIELAVALILALAFKDVVDSFVNGIITPIVSAIGGKQDFSDVGFDIGKGHIAVGLFLNTVISFIIIALVLFAIVKAYEQYQVRRGIVKEGAVAEEVELLREIRDELRASRR
jgi:large conductance mechanosensitive channel